MKSAETFFALSVPCQLESDSQLFNCMLTAIAPSHRYISVDRGRGRPFPFSTQSSRSLSFFYGVGRFFELLAPPFVNFAFPVRPEGRI